MADKAEPPKGCKVKACDCTHAYQDEKYGTGNRIYNRGGTALAAKWRCTVCSKVVVS